MSMSLGTKNMELTASFCRKLRCPPIWSKPHLPIIEFSLNIEFSDNIFVKKIIQYCNPLLQETNLLSNNQNSQVTDGIFKLTHTDVSLIH